MMSEQENQDLFGAWVTELSGSSQTAAPVHVYQWCTALSLLSAADAGS